MSTSEINPGILLHSLLHDDSLPKDHEIHHTSRGRYHAHSFKEKEEISEYAKQTSRIKAAHCYGISESNVISFEKQVAKGTPLRGHQRHSGGGRRPVLSRTVELQLKAWIHGLRCCGYWVTYNMLKEQVRRLKIHNLKAYDRWVDSYLKRTNQSGHVVGRGKHEDPGANEWEVIAFLLTLWCLRVFREPDTPIVNADETHFPYKSACKRSRIHR